MGKLRKNSSKSFQHVQDRFIGEVGKLFDEEHHGRECPNSVFIRVLFCALCHAEVQSSERRVEKATLNFALCTLHLHDASGEYELP